MGNQLDEHVEAYQGNTVYELDNHVLLNWYPQGVLALTQGWGSLLELGLGLGYVTSILAGNFDRHVVVAGSPSVMHNFRDRYPDCTVEIIGTCFESCDTAERFDTISVGFILEHLEDPRPWCVNVGSSCPRGGLLLRAECRGPEPLCRPRCERAAKHVQPFDNDRMQGHLRYYQ